MMNTTTDMSDFPLLEKLADFLDGPGTRVRYMSDVWGGEDCVATIKRALAEGLKRHRTRLEKEGGAS